MATTTNYGWETPDDTDFVKDGAAAIRTLGSSIDTSFVDLKGGTTGQILAKASNTDLDYSWVTNDVGDITAITASSPLTGGGTSGDVTIGILSGTTSNLGAVQLSTSTSSTSTSLAATASAVKSAYDLADAAVAKSVVDAKGDLLAGTADNTIGRLAIGTNGQVLVADSAETTGMKWASPSGKILQVVNVMKTDSFTTTSTSFTDITGLSASITPSATNSKILVFATLSMVGASGTNGALSRLLRDSTVIVQSDAAGSRDRTMSQIEAIATTTAFTSVSYLDTPNTTSALAYKIQTRSNVAAQTAYINRTITDGDVAGYGRSVSSITLMEVGA
jgi:hypothetical protein